MTTHHPKFCIHTALQLVGLTTERLLPTALFCLLFHYTVTLFHALSNLKCMGGVYIVLGNSVCSSTANQT